MAHFIPCVNTLFASLNRLLGNGVARRLLHSLDPEARRLAGFKCYYRHCSPAAVSRICAASGLERERLQPYFFSEYTRFRAADLLPGTATPTLAARAGGRSVLRIVSDRSA